MNRARRCPASPDRARRRHRRRPARSHRISRCRAGPGIPWNWPACRLANTCSCSALVDERGVGIAIAIEIAPRKRAKPDDSRKGLDRRQVPSPLFLSTIGAAPRTPTTMSRSPSISISAAHAPVASKRGRAATARRGTRRLVAERPVGALKIQPHAAGAGGHEVHLEVGVPIEREEAVRRQRACPRRGRERERRAGGIQTAHAQPVGGEDGRRLIPVERERQHAVMCERPARRDGLRRERQRLVRRRRSGDAERADAGTASRARRRARPRASPARRPRGTPGPARAHFAMTRDRVEASENVAAAVACCTARNSLDDIRGPARSRRRCSRAIASLSVAASVRFAASRARSTMHREVVRLERRPADRAAAAPRRPRLDRPRSPLPRSAP